MIKIRFIGAERILGAISTVSDDLGIQAVSANAEYTFEIKSTDTPVLSVSRNGKDVTIESGLKTAAILRGIATAVGWIRDGIDKTQRTESPIFTLIGAMVDMSRNAVMTTDTVKMMLRKMALMGMNAFMLYTEDTY